MKQAVIFDMDGVLVDSEYFYMDRTIAYGKTQGVTITRADLNDLVGASAQKTRERLFDLWQQKTDVDVIEKGLRAFEATTPFSYEDLLFEDTLEAVRYLDGQNIKMAVASASAPALIQQMLSDTGLEPYVDVWASGHHFERSKPDPAIYLHVLEQLGLPAKACLVVEDSPYGITAANRAGIDVAARIDTRFGFDQSDATYNVQKLTDLPALLRKIAD